MSVPPLTVIEWSECEFWVREVRSIDPNRLPTRFVLEAGVSDVCCRPVVNYYKPPVLFGNYINSCTVIKRTMFDTSSHGKCTIKMHWPCCALSLGSTRGRKIKHCFPLSVFNLLHFFQFCSFLGVRVSVPLDTLVATVQATDVDSLAEQITYHITNLTFARRTENPVEMKTSWPFFLDQLTGQIRTTVSMEQFSECRFDITVAAINSDTPGWHSNSTVKVTSDRFRITHERV